MAFRREVLERLAPKLRTIAEDAELSVLLAASGIRAEFALETFVLDPKPADRHGAARQRSRWLRGQLQVLRTHPGAILRLLLQGPPGWSLLAAIVAKPKSLFVPFAVALLFSLWSLGPSQDSYTFPWVITLLAALLILAVNGLAFAYSLVHSEDRRATARSLFAAPFYFLMWLRSLAMAVIAREQWPRSRPAAVERRGREAPIAG
jgi:cellulose synthase/poly-beta-1,6-N-acetylglucosamine synthase-like glycosyltransferase